MTVKELIEELKKQPQDATVFITDFFQPKKIGTISEIEDIKYLSHSGTWIVTK